MKFSLATLLLLVLLAALGCAALVNANDTWRQAMVTLTVSALLIATLAAAVNRSRAFALGFAVGGWIYLLLAFVPLLDLRDDLLTDSSVRWLFTTIHEEEAHASSMTSAAFFAPDGSRLVTTGNLTRAVRIWDLNAGVSRNVTVKFANFAEIGHSVWIILVACLGGAVASFWARSGRDKEATVSARVLEES